MPVFTLQKQQPWKLWGFLPQQSASSEALSWAGLPALQLSQGSGMWERGKREDAIIIASQVVSRLLGGDLIFHLSAPLDCKFFGGWTHIGFPFAAVTRHSNGLVVRYSVKTEGMHLPLEDTLKSTRSSKSLTEWHFNHLECVACSLNLMNCPVSLCRFFNASLLTLRKYYPASYLTLLFTDVCFFQCAFHRNGSSLDITLSRSTLPTWKHAGHPSADFSMHQIIHINLIFHCSVILTFFSLVSAECLHVINSLQLIT